MKGYLCGFVNMKLFEILLSQGLGLTNNFWYVAACVCVGECALLIRVPITEWVNAFSVSGNNNTQKNNIKETIKETVVCSRFIIILFKNMLEGKQYYVAIKDKWLRINFPFLLCILWFSISIFTHTHTQLTHVIKTGPS